MFGQQRSYRVGFTKQMMTELIENVIYETMPGEFVDPVSGEVLRLTYLMNNVIRVEPRHVGEQPRIFIVGVVVREVE